MSRPELIAPPEVYYNLDEANKYMSNTRIQKIQRAMTERAMELLNLPANAPSLLLLDIGCGTGLSGSVIEAHGHRWVGLDISQSMLDVAVDRGTEGDLIQQDVGLGVPFRGGVFDGAISISALQWLCNADRKDHIPQRRLKKFFTSLYASLARGARAVFQFYPANKYQLDLIVRQSERSGFTGGIVVDFPNSTRAKKYFLVLFSGPSSLFEAPEAKTSNVEADAEMQSETSDGDDDDDEEEEEVEDEERDDEEDEEEEVEDGTYWKKSKLNNSSGSGDGSQQQQASNISSKRRKVQISERAKKGGKGGGGKKRLPMSTKDWILWKKQQARSRGKQIALDSKYTGRKRKVGW